MARTDNGKWKIWILALAAMIAPAAMSARSQAAAQPAPMASVVNETDDDAEAAAENGFDLSEPQGICPFACNSSSACTIGCQTEALCIKHRCIPL